MLKSLSNTRLPCAAGLLSRKIGTLQEHLQDPK
jgi:hypothetical protein